MGLHGQKQHRPHAGSGTRGAARLGGRHPRHRGVGSSTGSSRSGARMRTASGLPTVCQRLQSRHAVGNNGQAETRTCPPPNAAGMGRPKPRARGMDAGPHHRGEHRSGQPRGRHQTHHPGPPRQCTGRHLGKECSRHTPGAGRYQDTPKAAADDNRRYSQMDRHDQSCG